MITIAGTSVSGTAPDLYKGHMSARFTIGDVIRKGRLARNWNQTKLGKEAARVRIRAEERQINKSTVSKVENDPYSSELGTVWRLLAALDLRFTDVERRVGTPFLEEREQRRARTPAEVTQRRTISADG